MASTKRVRRLSASAIALILSGGLNLQTARADALDEAFKSPPAASRPLARWWWPGGAVTRQGLEKGLDGLKDGQFSGGEIQPFKVGLRPGPDEQKAVDDYATPAFFAKVRLAAEAAKARGLQIDYTFGSGWPSGGGAAITPELALVELSMAATTVEGGANSPITLNPVKRTPRLGGFSTSEYRKDPRFADWVARVAAQQKIVAVIAVRGEAPELAKKKSKGIRMSPWLDVVRPGPLTPGSAIVLTDRLTADGKLDWVAPPGRWQVLVFRQQIVESGVSGGAGDAPQMVLDHFRREAFEAHARHVGDPLIAGLGPARSALGSVFIDSLELMQDLPWTPDFLAEFKRRRGYDLTPYLPLVLQPGWMSAWDGHYSLPYYEMGDLGERVRADYRQTLSDLQIENFFQPFADWARTHGVKSRLQAHGGVADLLKSYAVADIPESEDLENNGDPDFVRFARSAADHGGKTLVSAESFAFADHPYDITPAAVRARADRLFASGVNHIVEHGAPYPYPSETWPGWYPFAPTNYGGHGTLIAPANPLYPGFARVNTYITRMQAVLRKGRPEVAVALYYGEIGYYHGIEARGVEGVDPAQSLRDGGFDYDRINDDWLGQARVVDGALVTGAGQRYGALVFPAGVSLQPATAEKVAGFARQGLKVAFVETPPAKAVGLLDHENRDARVKAATDKALTSGAKVASAADLPATLRSLGAQPNLTFVAGTALFVERHVGRRSVYMLANPKGEAVSLVIDIPEAGGAELWDAWTGERRPLAPALGEHEQSRLTFDLAAGGSTLLVVGGRTHKAVTHPAESSLAQTVSGPWTVSLHGRGAKNRAVDQTLTLDQPGDLSQIAGLADFSGEAVYAATLAVPTKTFAPGTRLILDLGQVHDIASLTLNGRPFGVEVGPFVFDVTDALKAGANTLELKVVNSPNNALADERNGLKPAPAGLIGPVRLLARKSPQNR